MLIWKPSGKKWLHHDLNTKIIGSKLYIIQKVLIRAIQKNYFFIEFEPLCQTLSAFMSNFISHYQ